MTNAEILLIMIIEEYIDLAKKNCKVLKKKYNVKNLLSAHREQIIPSTGEIDNEFTFSFHGVGCTFEKQSLIVELDFSPDDSIIGFDLWRIELFYNSKESIKGFEIFQNKYQISNIFKLLIKSNIISKSDKPPVEHLYYLG